MEVMTDNSVVDDRIVAHVKCPDCKSENIMVFDTYREGAKYMVNIICNKCMENDKNSNKDIEIKNMARLESVVLPNGRQQMYFHIYEEDNLEDHLESSIQ